MSDFQELIDKAIKEARQKKFSKSKQITLGQLIEKIEDCGLHGIDDKSRTVRFDFVGAIPTTLNSWRGIYSELALGWIDSTYDTADVTVKNLLKELKSAIGKRYTGWKGGDFIMDENTPVWVDNPGKYSRTAIVGVKDINYAIVILTEYIDN